MDYPEGRAGNPPSKYGLGNDFAAWATEAGLPKRCRLHGLKKAGTRCLAEDGATSHVRIGVSGHKTLSEVQRYTDGADRRRLADQAMAEKRPRGQSENTDVTNTARPLTQTSQEIREKWGL